MRVRSITAGAGTGKTTKLTRVIRESVINGKCRPHAIIGTTFTNKAAGELVERVRQEFFRSGQIDLAERLAESLLGTVDSVCLRLLTRFAFEAGISPDIQIIADTEATALQSSAIENSCSLGEMQTIRRIGERLCQKERDGWELNWKTRVGVIAEKARENAISPKDLRAMAGPSYNQFFSYFLPPAPLCAALDAGLSQAIETALQRIPLRDDATKTTANYIQFLRECGRDLAEERLTWSQWVKLSKELPAKASLAEAQPVLGAAQRYEVHPQLRADIEQYTQLLFELAVRVLTRYQESKEERGLLDFVDLEQRTLELLQQPSVAAVVSEEFDLLVVDEFQDTNPIQLALFIRLAALVKEGAIWVGDVKQAIYGFRGSDPALMDAVLASVTSQKMQTLAITYRARPELVQIFNDLFIPSFEGELGLTRKDIELRANRVLNKALPVPLEFWVLSTGGVRKNGTPKGPTNEQSAHALAEGVVQLLANTNKVEDRDSGQLRPLQLRDVVVLCRKNERAEAVAEALQVRGLPVTLGTSGLLATPEERLTMACLRRMADPDDTLATAEIVALEAKLSPEEWLEDRLKYLAAHPEDKVGSRWGLEPPLLNGSVTALHQAHSQVNQLTPAEALDVALGAGNVFATISRWGPTENQSAQRRANVEAIRGFAQQYERSCAATHRPTTIAGFVFWCDNLVAGNMDSKATDERADAIHVMTYHTAKGLEWPVIICDDLDHRHRTDLWDPIVRQDLAFDARAPLANRRIAFFPWPFGGHTVGVPLLQRIENDTLGQEAIRAAAREELRLLYVGFTRARDKLILVTRNGQPSAWLDLLGAPWLTPLQGTGTPLYGLLGPAKVPYCTRTIESTAPGAKQETTSYRWFPEPAALTPKLPASIVPSRQPLMASAKVVKTIDLNKLQEARTALEKLKGGRTVDEMNPVQLHACPWCGTPLDWRHYWIATDRPRLVVSCREEECAFANQLPVYLVDEDVYNFRPTLLIATVDKFAGLPWLEQAASLFNLKESGRPEQPPPELIIQDELHLISGPLGTLVGLYETALDAVCGRIGARPKTIASTATIRRAGRQARALFDRSMRQFPPPGIDARDSYFAIEVPPDVKGTRLYLGLMAPGTSHTTLLVRTYAALLQNAADIPGNDATKDPYWTLVGYFNSLRVLGGAKLQVQDDVSDRMKLLARVHDTVLRLVENEIELTSREASSRIPAHLRQMAVSLPSTDTLDVILATNMISVGVDIDRLGLMVVMGQPQSTSEYIQSTSRVGRQHPGMIVVLFNAARSRDRSHYESFVSYHSALYRQVESGSVTPFSARARDRGLHAVLVSLARLLVPDLRDNKGAGKAPSHKADLNKLKALIVERVRRTEPDEAAAAEAQLTELIDNWEERADECGMLVFRERKGSPHSLLSVAGDDGHEDAESLPTLWSLRDVDQESNLYLV